jgi:hypothetical protein
VSLPVTRGQLVFEHKHLMGKLRERDPERFRILCRRRRVTVHPLFVVVTGGIEPWERGR